MSQSEVFDVIDGVKIFKFADIPKLIDKRDTNLRHYFREDYNGMIVKVLKFVVPNDETISYCSQSLEIPKMLYIDNKNTLTNQTNPEKKYHRIKIPLQNQEKVKEYLKQYNINDNPNIKEGRSHLIAMNDNDFQAIKDEFQQCNYLQYFIPLATFQLYDPVGHSNLLLFNKDDRRVTWIEPEYSEDIQSKPLITQTIINLLKYLELNPTEYNLDLPTKQCPQAITLDDNCMFWTFLLTMHLILNPKSTIDEVSSAMIKKYPTKELLSNYIENFKGFIYEKFILGQGGKRRRTIRRKPKNRKRTRKQKY